MNYSKLTDEELDLAEIAVRKETWRRKHAKKYELNAPLVGKCFVFTNSYGASDDCRTWPLYCMVTEVTSEGSLKTWQFQRTSKEIIEFNFDQIHYSGVDETWTPVSRRTFDAAYRQIMKTLNGKLAKTRRGK